MRRLEELNVNEGGKPVTRLPPTDEQFDRFESHFGLRLPEEFRALLRHSNGGHPELDAFRPEGYPESHLWGIDRFYFLTDDKSNIGCLWRATLEWQAVLGKKVVPVAHDPGGNQILLEYSSTPPSVLLCIHDENFEVLQVADSFSEFIDLLQEDPDAI